MPRTDTQASARTLVFYDFMETGKLRKCMPFFFQGQQKISIRILDDIYPNEEWILHRVKRKGESINRQLPSHIIDNLQC